MMNELRRIVVAAMDSFNKDDEYLIRNDLSERCICSRFAIHLTKALGNTKYAEYIVDVEYNRGADGCERCVKRISKEAPITVDLIVHKRGWENRQGFDNLICIEMKKSTDRRGCKDDEERLTRMVSCDYGFCYRAGFMILINMKKGQYGLEIKEEFPRHGLHFCADGGVSTNQAASSKVSEA